jgi:hypothetical protein
MNTGDEIPEFLRAPGVPDSSPPKGGPGGCELPGKVWDRAVKLPQPWGGGQAADGRKLISLRELDELLPQLQLRA